MGYVITIARALTPAAAAARRQLLVAALAHTVLLLHDQILHPTPVAMSSTAISGLLVHFTNR